MGTTIDSSAPKAPLGDYKPVSGTGAPSGRNELGMTEMMLWLTATMNKTDADVRAQMHQIEHKKEINERLGEIVNILRTAETQKWSDPPVCHSWDLENLVGSKYKESDWYKALPPSAQNAFESMKADFVADRSAKVDSVKATREAIMDGISANSSSNEMAMIKLQSAISARGQAIQLISNMVNAFNETAKSVVGNIR